MIDTYERFRAAFPDYVATEAIDALRAREYRRLEAKARGSIEAAEIQTTKASETPIGQEPPTDSEAGKTDGGDNGCTD